MFHQSMMKSNTPFFFEENAPYSDSNNTIKVYTHIYRFFGSPKNHNAMRNIIYSVEIIIEHDYSNETEFQNSIKNVVSNAVNKKDVYMLEGKLIGIKTKDMKCIELDDLLNQSTHIELHIESYGVIIPYKTMLNRHKYMWFVNESVQNILDGNYFLSSLFQDVYKNIM